MKRSLALPDQPNFVLKDQVEFTLGSIKILNHSL